MYSCIGTMPKLRPCKVHSKWQVYSNCHTILQRVGGTRWIECKDYVIYIYSCCDVMMGHTMKDKFNDHKKVMFIIKYLRSPPQEVGRRTVVDI